MDMQLLCNIFIIFIELYEVLFFVYVNDLFVC